MPNSAATAALAERGLVLPPPVQAPPGVSIPFGWVRVHGDRAFVSGHGALTPTGEPAGPFGSVPGAVTVDQAQDSACGALLSILSSLQRALGDLERVDAWLTVSAFVNADPGFDRLTLVANPMSQLIVELFGAERGAHARTAPGVAALPFDLPVIVAAEVALR